MAKNFKALIDKTQKKKDALIAKRDEYVEKMNGEIKAVQAELDFYKKKDAEMERVLAQLADLNATEYEAPAKAKTDEKADEPAAEAPEEAPAEVEEEPAEAEEAEPEQPEEEQNYGFGNHSNGFFG